MGYRTIWVDEGECKSCLSHPFGASIFNSRVTRERDEENTGFCMVSWYNCKCKDCGRTWEE